MDSEHEQLGVRDGEVLGQDLPQISAHTQEAFEAYVDLLTPETPFVDLLESVVDEAFHSGGESADDLIAFMSARITDDHACRDGFVRMIGRAVESGYPVMAYYRGFRGSFDFEEATRVLEARLRSLSASDTVYDLIQEIINRGMAVEDVGQIPSCLEAEVHSYVFQEWLQSDPVLGVLEQHFARLVSESIPGLYADQEAKSPVKSITDFIRNQLYFSKSWSGDVPCITPRLSDITESFETMIRIVVRSWGLEKYEAAPNKPTLEGLLRYFNYALKLGQRSMMAGQFGVGVRPRDGYVLESLADPDHEIHEVFGIEHWRERIEAAFRKVRIPIPKRPVPSVPKKPVSGTKAAILERNRRSAKETENWKRTSGQYRRNSKTGKWERKC